MEVSKKSLIFSKLGNKHPSTTKMNCFLLLFVLSFFAANSQSQVEKNWTIMYYAAGGNSSEVDLMNDVEEMKRGKKSQDYNLILQIDRAEGFSDDSTTLDGNFNDTRLYQIDWNEYQRLDGKEYLPEIGVDKSSDLNMADATVLKKFIQYCKKYYPAKHYLLIIRSHGDGISMCPDAEHGTKDYLYPAEISDVLSEEESVDILGLDVCSMAGLENFYQWRPNNNSFSANYIIASAPLSAAWAYDRLLERLTSTTSNNGNLDNNYFDSGKEKNLNPAKMTALDFSKLIMEEIYDSQRWASWVLCDNSLVQGVKEKIDEAAKLLAKEERSSILPNIESSFGYYHNISEDLEVAKLASPHLDAYDFWTRIANTQSLSTETCTKASEVCSLLDQMIVHSYYGRGYFPENQGFQNGKNGLFQVIPEGSRIYSKSNQAFWNHCNWFSPNNTSYDPKSYGKYDWCIDGSTKANAQVENFYELLDFLFDSSNDEHGGINQYRW